MLFPLPRAAALLATTFFTLLGASLSHGALLVYEGFNGYTGDMSSATPNGFTVGLNTSVPYAGLSIASYTVNASSLSFGNNFATSGGSITISGQTAVAAASLAIGGTAYTGTLYNSYLVRLTNRGSNTGDGGGARVASGIDSTGERFLAFADHRNGTTQVAIGYGSGNDNSTAVGNSLTLNTNYLIISRFNGVGSGGTQSGTIFAFTLAQYEAFLAAGGTEAVLDSLTVAGGGLTAKGSDSGTTAAGFASGNYVQFVSAGNSGQFDELRYGSTLADVIPIPEPGAGALGLAGLAGLLARRRRRN